MAAQKHPRHRWSQPGTTAGTAIDRTRLRTELGRTPGYADFALGLTATVEWSRANEAWWRPLKGVTEARYAAAAGR